MKSFLLLSLSFAIVLGGCKSQKRRQERQEAESKYKEEQTKQPTP